jgi:hypothetical protein
MQTRHQHPQTPSSIKKLPREIGILLVFATLVNATVDDLNLINPPVPLTGTASATTNLQSPVFINLVPPITALLVSAPRRAA